MSFFHSCRNIITLFLLIFLITLAVMAAKEDDNVRSKTAATVTTPVIGILSQPYYRNGTQEFWIPASYVKWVESAGARVLPIPYHASPEVVLDIFHQTNGILFPGGGSPLPESAKIIYKLAMESNSNKTDFFPIWGTCLGFEYLIQLMASSSNNILQSGFQAENVSFPLTMWPKSNSRLYANEHIQRIASTQAVAMNNHHQGIEPEAFLKDEGLTSMFTISTVNRDVKGRSFVSTIEPVEPDKFPVYGVQFHPEKNAFEYNTWPGTNTPYEAIPHTPDAIKFSLHLAQFFVNLTRKNMGRTRHEYTKPLQYPLVQTYEVKHDVKFEQVYVIPNDIGDKSGGDTAAAAVGSTTGSLLRHGTTQE